MMELIKDLPDDVVGIAARGKITAEDYEHVVIPSIEKKLKEHDKIKLLFVMSHFDGMELAALWEDATFGLKHWTDFSHLALVTDEEWTKNMTAFFAWMVPAEVRVFTVGEEEAARAWLATARQEAA